LKLIREDWNRLRYPFAMLGVAIISMVLMFVFSDHRMHTANSDLSAQNSQLQQAKQRFEASGLEKETIVKYLPIYQRLIDQGVIGQERRIEWVDGLRKIHLRYKLFNINYTIGVQESYKPSFISETGDFQLYRSTMKLDLSMLHEGDLITLLNGLEELQTTPYIVRQCELRRLTATTTRALQPNMSAHCEIDWLTIREPQTLGASQ
jgi:hypothetical protein